MARKRRKLEVLHDIQRKGNGFVFTCRNYTDAPISLLRSLSRRKRWNRIYK